MLIELFSIYIVLHKYGPRAHGFLKLLWFTHRYVCVCVCVSAPEDINYKLHETHAYCIITG